MFPDSNPNLSLFFLFPFQSTKFHWLEYICNLLVQKRYMIHITFSHIRINHYCSLQAWNQLAINTSLFAFMGVIGEKGLSISTFDLAWQRNKQCAFWVFQFWTSCMYICLQTFGVFFFAKESSQESSVDSPSKSSKTPYQAVYK